MALSYELVGSHGTRRSDTMDPVAGKAESCACKLFWRLPEEEVSPCEKAEQRHILVVDTDSSVYDAT